MHLYIANSTEILHNILKIEIIIMKIEIITTIVAFKSTCTDTSKLVAFSVCIPKYIYLTINSRILLLTAEIVNLLYMLKVLASYGMPWNQIGIDVEKKMMMSSSRQGSIQRSSIAKWPWSLWMEIHTFQLVII